MINDIYFDDFPVLKSERLLLRSLNIEDAANIQLIRSNEEVMKFLDSDKHVTIQQSQEFIAKSLETAEKKEGVFWAITDKSTNEFLGDISFWRIDHKNARAEIGYTLRPQFWNKGYMKEAMSQIIHFGFSDLGLHSVEANINPANESSRRLLLSVGFRKEAYFRENYYFNGKFLDSEIYSLLEKDFIPVKRN